MTSSVRDAYGARTTLSASWMTRFLAVAVAVALLAGAVTSTHAAPASASVGPTLLVDVQFDGNLNNQAATPGGTIESVGLCSGVDAAALQTPCNATEGFGSDAFGTFWTWTTRPPGLVGSGRSRVGGGLKLTTAVTLAPTDEYTLGLRFSFSEVTSYRKIVDYLNQANDTGFYIYDGEIIFFNLPNQAADAEAFTVAADQVIDLLAVRSRVGRVGSGATFTVYAVSADGVRKILEVNDNGDQSLPHATGSGSLFGLFYDDGNGTEFTPSGAVYSVRLWDGPLEFESIASAMGAPLDGSGTEETKVPDTGGPSWVPLDGDAPSLPAGVGVWVQTDGEQRPLTLTSQPSNGLRYESDGISVTFTGARGTSAANGLVADANGEIVCEVCVALAAGQVIEVWMFSEPRLVAAHLTEDLPCQRFSVPVVAPLDGGGPVSAGVHTLQLALPTSSGMQAVNVGVTVGGPVPASVPAGEGGVPMPLALLLAALLSAGGAVLVGRRALAVG